MATDARSSTLGRALQARAPPRAVQVRTAEEGTASSAAAPRVDSRGCCASSCRGPRTSRTRPRGLSPTREACASRTQGTKKARGGGARRRALDPPDSTRAVGLESCGGFQGRRPAPEVHRATMSGPAEFEAEAARKAAARATGGNTADRRGGDAAGARRRTARAASGVPADGGPRRTTGRRSGKLLRFQQRRTAERALRAEAGVRGGQGQGRQAQGQSQVQAHVMSRESCPSTRRRVKRRDYRVVLVNFIAGFNPPVSTAH